MLLLLDTRNDKHYTGTTVTDVVQSTGVVTVDFDARRAVIKGKPDTVSFSTDYSHIELVREVHARALQVLCCHHDWALFRSDI